MVDESIIDKLGSAITSTESLAAFLGVFAAFSLEALRRWRSERLARLAAGNEAVFALSQMYSYAIEMYRQQFEEQVERFKTKREREPNYSEFWPVEGDAADVARLRIDCLGFLLRSHDPDLLNRLATVNQWFGVMAGNMNQLRSAQHGWQQAVEKAFRETFIGDTISLEQMEDLVGPYLSVRLKRLTEGLRQELPQCANQIKTVGEQLSEVLSFMFPTKGVSRFGALDRKDATTLPPDITMPSRWRRCVRAITRFLRTPLKSLAIRFRRRLLLRFTSATRS